MTNSERVLHWYEQIWHQGNEAIVHQMLHPQFKAHGLATQAIVGPDQFLQFYRVFRARFPRVRIEVKKILADGDFVSLRGKATFEDAEGNSYQMRGSLMAQFEDGLCVEAWDNWDFLGLLVQMGAVAPTAMAEAMSGTTTTN